MDTERHLTLTNWGAYQVETNGTDVIDVQPFAKDPDPSPIGQSLKAVRRSRVERPAIRESWFRDGHGANPQGRGHEPFVEVEWDVALDLLAAEIERVRNLYGNSAIFGGSYGWASAGRFHHAQTQIHRFLGSIGGYVSHVDDYSTATGHVMLPRIFGLGLNKFMEQQPSLADIASASDMVVSFGGMPLKNSQVMSGGQGRHMLGSRLENCRDRGVRFLNFSPLRDDMIESIEAEWVPMLPGTDTAVLLALAHSLLVADNHDERFLETHCVGWEELKAYLLGKIDGVVRSADWASQISAVSAERIRSLASEMAACRTLVTASWSIQRTDHGEQTYWMASALAAMLGQIGLPGGGVGFGYGAVGYTGNGIGHHDMPRFPIGKNDVPDYIPVARIADMLLHGGDTYDYNCQKLTYPDIHLVYWAGGNPFHHHQDLNRLERAWQKPDTVVSHEPFWNALAKHSDIVLPATTTLERNDIGGSGMDDFIFWMGKAIDRVGDARNDYDIFSGLSTRLGSNQQFTEGRSSDEWLEHMYSIFQADNPGYPQLEELKQAEFFQIPTEWIAAEPSELVAFRADPTASPLSTPSGLIEIFSESIAHMEYADCAGHPTWMEPEEWTENSERYPLALVSNQPESRLHSQLDHGETSLNDKVAGRERIGMAPPDAKFRSLVDNDLVRVFNDRGACMAAVIVRVDLVEGVVQLPTGAWWDPVGPGGMCLSGNPNVLTHDGGTSSMAQGPSTTCMVQVERFEGVIPRMRAHEPPELLPR